MTTLGWKEPPDDDGLDLLRVLLVIACGAMFYFAIRAYG